MLIACDLDRTLLPNGNDPDDGMLETFLSLVENSPHTLVYVTGRTRGMVENAYSEFGLHAPDYLIGEVGTSIFKKTTNDTLLPFKKWEKYIVEQTPNWEREKIVARIKTGDELYLQEHEVQNKYKISYYTKDEKTLEVYVEYIRSVVEQISEEGIQVVGSIDPHKQVGLIDILPTVATKETALNFLVDTLGLNDTEVVYAGDSGNDILPITSGYKAILVHNADESVKEEVVQIAQERGISEKIYIAKGINNLNGNYASGVLEGLVHFEIFSSDILQKS